MNRLKDVYTRLLVYLEHREEHQHLKTLCNNLEKDFSNFLKVKPPDQNDRTKLEKRENIKDRQELVDCALLISKKLDINEVYTLDLVRETAKENPGLEPEDLEPQVLAKFFDERKYLLYCLSTIVGASCQHDLYPEVESVIRGFTSTLLQQGKLIDIALEHLKSSSDLSDLDPIVYPFYVTERQLVADNLFFIFYNMAVPARNMKQLLGVLEQYSKTLVSDKEVKNLEREKRELSFAVSLLIVSFIANLQHDLPGLGTWPGTARALPRGNDLDELENLLGATWENGNILSILAFSYSLLWKRNDNQIGDTIARGVWGSLCTLVSDLKTAQGLNSETYIGVLDDLFSAFVATQCPRISELKRDAEGLTRGMAIGVTEPRDRSHPFKDMIRFVSLLYEVLSDKDTAYILKGVPELCKKFWDDTSTFKHFLRIVGDNVQPQHSALYLRMIASLASGDVNAYQAFYYLSNHQSRLNLNYLFDSLQRYVADFQSLGKSDATQLEPIELEVIIAMIHFVRVVIQNSVEVFHAMLANNSWQFFDTMFKFLVCPVPTTLKAEIVGAITAFAESPEMAPKIWHNLECSQVINTVPGSTTTDGLKHEVTSIEAREREYPYLEAFLGLIEKLLRKGGVPEELGMQHRPPGILPYVSFILSEVVLRFTERDYKDEASKWRVGKEDFERRTFQYNDKSIVIPKPPGFELLYRILSGDGEELRQKLDLRGAYTRHVELAIRRVFEIIELVLEKQRAFMYFNQRSSSPKLVRRFEQFLIQKRGKSIRLILEPTTNPLGYPSLVMTSLNILYSLSQLDGMQPHLIAILKSREETIKIMNGVCAILELPPHDDMVVLSEDDDSFAASPETSLRMAVMRILIDNLKYQDTNLTHLILGFDITALQKTDLQKNAYHPLEIILSSLQESEFSIGNPDLTVQYYELIYKLCSSKTTSDTTFRYLKSQKNNFFLQVQQVYLRPEPHTTYEIRSQLEWRAWFLKTVALEIYREKDSRSYVQRILDSLFAKPERLDSGFLSTDDMDALSDHRMVMHSLLDALDIPLPTPTQLGAIDGATTELLRMCNLQDCTTEDEYRFPITDVKKFHQIMIVANTKLARRQSGASPAAIETVLKFVCMRFQTDAPRKCVEWNTFYSLFRALCNFFKAWKEILSSTLLFSFGILKDSDRESILYTLLEELLLKLNRDDIQNPLQGLIAAAVLLLMRKLRDQKFQQYSHIQQDTSNLAAGRYLPIGQLHSILSKLVSGLMMVETNLSTRGNLYAALLNYLQFTHRPFLHMTRIAKESAEKGSDNERAREVWFANEIHNQWVKLEHGNQTILSGAGERLVQTLAMDADSGTKIVQSVAFSLLDWLVKYDGTGKWTQGVIVRSGYLKNYLSDLQESGFLTCVLSVSSLPSRNSFELTPEKEDDLFVHEAKLSMLISLAEVPHGAKCIIENNIIPFLSQCDFIDRRPESTGMREPVTHSNSPAADVEKWADILERYHDLLYPVLQLLAVCLNTLPGRPEVADQVIDFILTHTELFAAILRDRTSVITLSSLQQLEAITRIFYLLTPFWERLTQLNAFQSMLLNLLAKYGNPERLQSIIKPITTYEKFIDTQEQPLSRKSQFMNLVQAQILHIWRNLVSFCRAISLPVLSGSANKVGVEQCQVIFTPSLTGALAEPSRWSAKEDIPMLIGGDNRSLSLSTLVIFLRVSLYHLEDVMQEQDDASKKLNHITELSEKELVGMLTSEEQDHLASHRGEFSITQLQKLAQKKLSQIQVDKTAARHTLYYIIENILLMLWSHLFQFLKSKPSDASLTAANVALGRKRDNIVAQISGMTGEQKQELQNQASIALISHNNILEKLEKLPEIRQPSVITILVKKLREVLKSQ